MSTTLNPRPKFVRLAMVSIPDPTWRAEHGAPAKKDRAAPAPTHPHIVVVAYIDEHGEPWIYDEATGLRRILRDPNDADPDYSR